MATRTFFLLLCILPGLVVPTAFSRADTKPIDAPESMLEKHRSVKDFDRCDWLVSYRNRTYDLAPLTRGSLGRPLEGDIRAVLRRVPESADHLDQVEHQAKLAKTHSIIGSAGITTFIIGRIMRNDPLTQTKRSKQTTIDLVGLVGLVLFVKSTLDSHNASEQARNELALAVDSFNDNSPHKIIPFKEENE